MTQKGWNVLAGGPECNSEDNASQKIRSSSRTEPFRNRLNDENADSTHYSLHLYFDLKSTMKSKR